MEQRAPISAAITEKLMRGDGINSSRVIHFIVGAALALPIASNVFAQNPAASPSTPTEATMERVIITGSNIPTAEETGPNPVDTYRREDIEKLGVHNATDLLTKLPQEMGSTVNQNIANCGDGSIIPNPQGFLPKETQVLIAGKRPTPIG